MANVWDFTFTVGESVWTFSDETSADEEAIPSRVAEYDYPGVDGVEQIILGDDPRTLTLTAGLHGANAAALRTLMDGVDAMRGLVGTLSIRGGEDSWGNTIVQGAPRYSNHYPPQPDGTVGCRVEIVFRQLIPA